MNFGMVGVLVLLEHPCTAVFQFYGNVLFSNAPSAKKAQSLVSEVKSAFSFLLRSLRGCDGSWRRYSAFSFPLPFQPRSGPPGISLFLVRFQSCVLVG